MRKILSLFFLVLLLASCGSSKKAVTYSQKKTSKKQSYVSSNSKQSKVVKYAKSYLGTPYKFGGINHKGMDCSGLVYTSFQKVSMSLPRVSYDMSKKGKSIKIKDAKEGDLVFFKTTNKSRKLINHVGVISKVDKGVIYFIHSTSSKGVIESSLKSSYWNKAFKFVRRVL